MFTLSFCVILITRIWKFFLGRIRTTPECDDDDSDTSVLSLGIFPGDYYEKSGDDRYFINLLTFIHKFYVMCCSMQQNISKISPIYTMKIIK